MAEPLENLARRLEDDPFFLGCALRLYTTSARLSEQELAERLGCPVQTLVLLRLCRAPKPEGRQFQKDIARIAEHGSAADAVGNLLIAFCHAIGLHEQHIDRSTKAGVSATFGRRSVPDIGDGSHPSAAGSLLAARDSDGDVNLEEDR